MTSKTMSNCVLGFLYLWIRGKIDRVALITTNSPWWPWHVLAITKNDRVLHFGVSNIDGDDHPWWYEGHFWIMSRDRALHLLEKHERELIGEYNFGFAAKLFTICFSAAMFFPFVVGWFVYPIWNMLYWTWDAIQKGRK